MNKEIKITSIRGQRGKQVMKALHSEGLIYRPIRDKQGFRLDLLKVVN